MEYIWNSIELPMPPLIVVPVKHFNFDTIEFKKIVNDAINFYECQNNFNQNSILCSQLIKRRKHSFKNFKGYSYLGKIDVASRRLKKLDMINVLKNFKGLLPESISSLELPCRTNLHYILLRLIGFYKILSRICICCKYSVDYFVRLLRNNFFIDTISLILSILAKIWHDGNSILKFTSKLFLSLKKYLTFLPQNKSHYYDKCVYPNELDENSFIKIVKNACMKREELLTVVEFKGECIKLAQSESNSLNVSSSSEYDIGEVVSRESIKN